ncbi:MAG: proteasome subunit alpha, partial [Candidatus Micrarchaeia archaeon]
DARRLVEIARVEAQRHRVAYNEPITVEFLAKHLSDMMQIYTQYGGIRPFGVSLLIAGVDSIPRLYEAEPSGALTGYKADAIGNGKKEVEEFFEKHYKDNIDHQAGIALALKALKEVTDTELKPTMIDIAVLYSADKKMKVLSEAEVGEYISKI